MSNSNCARCGTSTTGCGCKDTPYTTPLSANCQPSSTCPTPSKCSEYMDAACVFLNDGINDVGITAGDSLEEVIQKLVLFITNPACSTGTGTLTFLTIPNVPEYVDNAAAILAGAAVGSVYRTGDLLKIVH